MYAPLRCTYTSLQVRARGVRTRPTGGDFLLLLEILFFLSQGMVFKESDTLDAGREEEEKTRASS